MPLNTPWSTLNQQRVAQLGMQALASGQVSPEEAAANAEEFFGKKQVSSPATTGQIQPNPIAMGTNPLPSSPVSMAAGVGGVPAPGSFTKTDNTVTEKGGNKDTQNKFFDPTQVVQAADVIRNLPEVQNLNQGEDNMQNILSMAMSQRSADPGWVKPLLALTDSQTGSKLMQGYTAGPKAEDTNAMLLKYSDELQKRKADIAKNIIHGISAQKGGGLSTTQEDRINQVLNSAGAKTPGGEIRQKMDEVRYRQLLSLAERSPGLMKSLGAAQTAQTELDLADPNKTGPVSKEQFEEIQNMVRRLPGALTASSGGNTTGHERDAMTMRSMEKDLGKMWDTYIKNGVNEIPADDPQLKHFRGLASHIRNRFQSFYTGKLQGLSASAKSMFDRNPELKSDWDGYLLANMELSSGGSAGQPDLPTLPEQPKAARKKATAKGTGSTGGKPNTVIQNGHTYTLNPKTGEYE